MVSPPFTVAGGARTESCIEEKSLETQKPAEGAGLMSGKRRGNYHRLAT
jgi:hypothetical protein